MNNTENDWEDRVAAVWKMANTMPPDELRMAINALADEKPADNASALFERGCVCDSTGMEAEAEKFYRAALASNLASNKLDAYRRSRATIQLASTLRNLGRLDESEQLLIAELDSHMQVGNPRALHDEARAILALTYVAQGRATEAAGLALSVLAPHLTRYNRSITAYTSELVKKSWS